MRKLFAGLMATALIATAFVFPANAAYTATENFHVYINGGSVVSSKRAEKQLATALPMWAWVVEQEGSSVDWLPSEYVNITPQLSSKRTLLMKDRFPCITSMDMVSRVPSIRWRSSMITITHIRTLNSR